MKAMKFLVKSASPGLGRKGVISDIPRLPGLTIETPAVMLFTKGASIPHLTREVLHMVTQDQHIMQLPLLTTLHMQTGAGAQGKGLAHFASVEDHLSLMVLQDPTVVIPPGKLETDKMPLWTKTGKIHLNADKYMDVVECFKPDIYAALCDGCTDDESSKKRLSKAVDRSAMMFARCLERHKASDYLSQNSSLLGVIEGGNSLEQRKKSLQPLFDNAEDLGGFILDGIDYNAPLLEKRNYESIKTLVESIMPSLPEDKLRLIQGCWNAVTLLDLVLAGWDMFDSSLPYQCTERGGGLIFSFNIGESQENSNNETIDDGISRIDIDKEDWYEIDLKDPKYKEDFSPILKGCECLCCKKYTRAYINHLLNTKELLSGVLLTIHNLHHYIQFFKCIRENATTDRLLQIRGIISAQHSRYEEEKKLKGPEKTAAETKRRRLSVDSLTSDTDSARDNLVEKQNTVANS